MPSQSSAIYQPESESSCAQEIRIFKLLMLALQFGLFLIVVYLYDLESRAFLHLGIVTFFGFLIHYFLPLRFRRAFFAGLSIYCLATVFGFQMEQWSLPGLAQAGWIFGLGLGLIGLCHLPIAFAARVLLVFVAGIALCVLRAGVVPVPWSGAIWPVLGSMFMFRTAVYLHAIRYDKQPISLLDAVCYFFMLPNPCFPLFPVVDFQTYRRTYYDAPDRHQIYQSGVSWLFRGATHLILYRFVYHNMVIDSSDVTTLPQLIQYLVWPFLLYLRISGQFHIIVGLLHLFGFNLPETHHLYYLSSSFTDFWRRINIYWKDFLMKLVFYPAYFRIRRWGDTTALILSTALVFFATWILHAYQWFWIRGAWLLTWNDALFWAILAVIVIVNAVYEAKHGRRRTLHARAASWRDMLRASLKTITVFCVICTLWSFWSAKSIADWFSAFNVLSTSQASDYLSVVPILACLLAAIGFPAAVLVAMRRQSQFSFHRSAFAATMGLLAVIAFQSTFVREKLDPKSRDVVASLARSDLNRVDFAEMDRGYYENLLDVSRFNAELLDVYRTRPKDWAIGLGGEQYIDLDHPPFFDLRPHFEGRDRGAMVRMNSWGMRDKEYARERPDGVVRIAVLGASFVQGVGVENHETFEAVLEDRLNAATDSSSSSRFEVLNFGVAGYTQLQQVGMIENKVFDFSPNLVFYIEHADPFVPTMQGLVNHVRSGRIENYDGLMKIAARAAVDRDTDQVEIKRKLQPFQNEVLLWIYRQIVDTCKSHGIPAIWVYLPRPEEFDHGPSELEVRLAREAGFRVLILEDVYQADNIRSLWLARWDHHPNAEGHQMIAQRLFEAIQNSRLIPSIDSKEGGGHEDPELRRSAAENL